MGRQGREDYSRDNTGYASPLEDQEDGEEELEEEAEPAKGDENFAQECQDYYERRERLKELERQRLRRSREDGKTDTKKTNKPLPYDNYGSFFGPSEPIVARRIIADARAREEVSRVAARQAREISEHRVSKGSSGISNGVSSAKFTEKSRQPAVSKEAATERGQRMKEALDYSFLFSDEDPAALPPKNDAQTTKKESDHRVKQASPSAKGGAATQRPANAVKPGSSTSAKPALGAKVTKGSIPMASKGQDRYPSKPPERPPLLKARLSSQGGSKSDPSKTSSGPGRPLQARPSQGISNGKKPVSSTVPSQLKSLVASAPKGVSKQSMPTKGMPGKPIPSKPPPSGGVVEKKSVQFAGRASLVSSSRPDQKRSSVGTVGRGAPTGHQDQRRPPQSVATSKQVMRPPSRVPKRQQEWESDDSFLDDDDGDGGDVSSMIQKMFGYNPNKYRDLDDEDDRFMETNFHSLQMEEKRSARIAREEDDRELALIEEEERRERERERAKKKRKQQR